MDKSRIFLIGFMGSGKSFWAKHLSQKMNFTTYDLDTLIEQQEQQSITQIFAQHGEDYFRRIEHHALLDCINYTNAIIACGGGTPCFYDNMQWINKNGLSIFLNFSIDLITQRLLKAKHKRPLIANTPKEKLKQTIEEKIKQRLPYYQQAHITITKDDITLEEIYHIIQKA